MIFDRPLGSHLLVLTQGAGMLLATVPNNSLHHHPAPLMLSLAGLVLALWTVYHNRIGNFSVYPEIKQGARLITSGPYRRIRHPMYLSLFLLMAGITIFNHGWYNWTGLLLVAMAIVLKIEKEEKYLLHTFPGYAEYRQKTCKVFWPVY
ncbi:methyltransferase family protein [Gynuella sunshinyii]|uniref:Isoprenylcysteine carboxylmethyltransferase family protein n=1 Tax=Gynuella sunshinyii YC6258 TaxID=1445510 RepID=A0A0C5VU10_9GAMM|nr:isoprenylcysteine carboxylmethyltransferase family protein [Gynuella sunshinyii]AJQ93854.1 putative protein-S-isoprenylcysteine methyltransferase [Gynuella sunshinyii YC6258]